jgi:two-component system cell cycle response regulator DivK
MGKESRTESQARRSVVLIVDDHYDLCALYSLYLDGIGFIPHVTADSRSAFDLALTYHPAAIVTDLGMPHVDGWMLLHRLKGDDRTRDIPVVVLSGQGDEATRFRAEHEGCAAFLPKPCLPDTLGDTLKDLMLDGAPPPSGIEPSSRF